MYKNFKIFFLLDYNKTNDLLTLSTNCRNFLSSSFIPVALTNIANKIKVPYARQIPGSSCLKHPAVCSTDPTMFLEA